jgi:biopolymer transport protein ExbD
MKISRKNKNSKGIADSGTLSDLAFLLIIFFIVIAVFNVNEGFILGLPRVDSAKLVNAEEIIKVYLNENNELFYKEEKMTLEELEELVSENYYQKPDMTFLLKVSPDARYQDFVNVVDSIRKLEVENFSFSMQEL